MCLLRYGVTGVGTDMSQNGDGTRATRRSSEEVRNLLLKAAGELFGENGYSGVTTRQIAERAGVSEAILWRQFRTKAALFNVAGTAPIVQCLSDLVQQVRAYAEAS